jgi:hypothetical protein
LHSGLAPSSGLSHVPTGQHASHVLTPEPEPEIKPLLEIDTPGIMLLQAERAASLGMQVPSEPLQNSQPSDFTPVRSPPRSPQLSWVQVASIVTVSPAQPLHVHVFPEASSFEPAYRHGGHSFVAAQQPSSPGLEPSAHVAAEASAPLPSEAAAESSGHAVPLVWQARQALHSGLATSSGLSHVPTGQHAPQVSTPEPEPEIKPLLEIDTPGIMLLQAERAASLGMQVPSEPLQNSQPMAFKPVRSRSLQLSWVQVASIVTVSPAQPPHVHVFPEGFSFEPAYRHGGHSFVAAQQPSSPGLEPSAHVTAEAQTAKTSTRNAVSLLARAIDCLLGDER